MAEPLPPNVQLMQLITGKWVAQAVSVAARYRIADLLAQGPLTAREIARATETNAASLYRVLRALASVGVFTEDAEGRFALTAMSEFLKSGVPGSMRAVATYCCDPWSWQPWGELATCVKSGQPAFDRLFGKGVFDYLGEHPDEAATFNEGMTGFSTMECQAILKSYDFTPFPTIVDVGGGHGSLLAEILKTSPNSHGILFDAPAVVAGAHTPLQVAGLTNRCRVEGGDFFQSVPAGGDLILMKHIIHDWNDEKSTMILRCCREAIQPTGKLLLAELVIPGPGEPSFGKLLDLEMLVICDGKERTATEYQTLLAGAGFRMTRVIATGEPINLVEAVPA